MSKPSIEDANFEETGYSYTLSLKYFALCKCYNYK